MPHPATMFFLLTLAVILLSWIFDVYGLSVLQPQTGEEIRVQSLLSPEGIRWLLRHVITNFTGFAPLGLVIVAMFGIGVAQHSGFIDACIRRGVRRPRDPWRIILLVIVLGLLSNIVGDAGYIILLPIAATLFQSVGLHPIGGIITAYVSVSCGYSANVFLSTLDPMIASVTQEAADRMNIRGRLDRCAIIIFSLFPRSCLHLSFIILPAGACCRTWECMQGIFILMATNNCPARNGELCWELYLQACCILPLFCGLHSLHGGYCGVSMVG